MQIGDHGGNMDSKVIKKGSRLYFPVTETPEKWYVNVARPEYEEALKCVCTEMQRLIMDAYAWDKTDAFMEFPMGGSVYTYVQHGINHHVGFIAGWMILLDYIFVPALLYKLVRLVNFGAIFSFIMLNVAVIYYFFGKKKLRNAHGIWNFLVLPLIGIVILGYVFTGFDKICYIVGFCWLIVGIIIGYVKSNGYKEVPESFKHMEM